MLNVKKSLSVAIVAAVLLSACGNSGDTEQLQAENESLRAQLSEVQESSETTIKTEETTVTTTVSETESVTTTVTEETTTVITADANVDYRPGMYLKYVRPCAEKIGEMSRSELESLLADIDDVNKTDNDKYYFNEFGDAEYTYNVRVSKNTGVVDLVAISVPDFTFNVYIKYDGSKTTYSLNGEYGTGITTTFDKEADSLEESEQFIFTDRFDYANVNSGNPETISLDEYNQLEIGMSYSDVAFIIGGHGEKLSESEIDGYYTSVYGFEGEGEVGANAVLMFQNGSLYSMAQTGLK